MFVEQAIYTSARTRQADGYQLVAHSPGLPADELRELSAWGPSHDALHANGPEPRSVNFHRLTSGRYCVSQTIAGGGEYSLRQGPLVYTQFLVAAAEDWLEFHFQPFDLLEAAAAGGWLEQRQAFCDQLTAIELWPSTVAARAGSVIHRLTSVDAIWLAALADLILRNQCVGLVAGNSGPALVQAVVSCLPLEWRAEVSFTTGLRFSPRRPFQVCCLAGSTLENQRLARQHQLTLCDATYVQAIDPAALTGWAGFIWQAARHQRFGELVAEVEQWRGGRNFDCLQQQGDQARSRLTAAQLRTFHGPPQWPGLPARLPRENEQASGNAADTSPAASNRGTKPADFGQAADALPMTQATSPSIAVAELPTDLIDRLLAVITAESALWPTNVESSPGEIPAQQVISPLANVRLSAAAVLTTELGENPTALPGLANEDAANQRCPQPPISTSKFDVWTRADGSHPDSGRAFSCVLAGLSHNELHDDGPRGPTRPISDARLSGQAAAAQFEIEHEPAFILSQLHPHATEALHQLEDAIFEAIAGKEKSLVQLRGLWPEILAELGQSLAAQTREEFLRYALAIWRQFTNGDDIGDPEKASRALEAICVLFGQ